MKTNPDLGREIFPPKKDYWDKGRKILQKKRTGNCSKQGQKEQGAGEWDWQRAL